MFSCEFWKISKNTFFSDTSGWLLVKITAWLAIVYTKIDTLIWHRMTMSNSEWQRGATNNNEWLNKWKRVTTNGTTSDNECEWQKFLSKGFPRSLYSLVETVLVTFKKLHVHSPSPKIRSFTLSGLKSLKEKDSVKKPIIPRTTPEQGNRSHIVRVTSVCAQGYLCSYPPGRNSRMISVFIAVQNPVQDL